MITTFRYLALSLVISLAGPAAAQEWILGAGFSDYSRDASEDGAAFVAEYHAAPFRQSNTLAFGLGGVAEVQATGDTYLGGGLVTKLDLSARWFVETSLMAGAYFEAQSENDLGSVLEFRSLLGVGRVLDNGQKISLSVSHKSNANIATNNPGVNTIALRWHKPLN